MRDSKELYKYASFILARETSLLRAIEFRQYPALVASVIHREGRFQTELVQAFPNQSLPAHRHPHINALEILLSGDLRITKGLTPASAVERLSRAHWTPEEKVRLRPFFIPATAWHAAESGERGAMFLSVQEWIGYAPLTAAGVDWEEES